MESSNTKKTNQLDFLKNKLNCETFDKDNINQNSPENFNQETFEPNEENFKIKRICIIDTETTGLDENKDHVIEVGGILFDVQSRSVLSQISFLLPVDTNSAEHINGISASVSNIPQPWEEALKFFLNLVDYSDLLIAHNAEFDKKWFGRETLPNLNKKWICSLNDINWSFKKTLKSRPSVTDLALAFGIPVWNLHRALSDCYYLSEVFKNCHDLEDILLKAMEPKHIYKAIVSYEDRLLAKKAGFLWNNHLQGAWTKKLSEDELINLDFKVELLN